MSSFFAFKIHLSNRCYFAFLVSDRSKDVIVIANIAIAEVENGALEIVAAAAVIVSETEIGRVHAVEIEIEIAREIVAAEAIEDIKAMIDGVIETHSVAETEVIVAAIGSVIGIAIVIVIVVVIGMIEDMMEIGIVVIIRYGIEI